MKLSFHKPETAGQSGPEMLVDRGILAAWFIEYRLAQEIERARRYDRPLAVLRATPQTLAGEALPEQALAAAAEAATVAARATDIVGWEGPQTILILMPETPPEAARVAAARWRNEIWVRSRGFGGHKWQLTLLEWQITPLDEVDESARPVASGLPAAGRESAA